MRIRYICIAVCVAVVCGPPSIASQEEAWLESSVGSPLLVVGLTEDEQDKESDLYDAGTDALDEEEYDRAIAAFDKVIGFDGRYAAGATYWKAYAQYKSAQRAEALGTLATLRRDYPDSRWFREARALEVEIRQGATGDVEPEETSDEELKLLILSSLMSSDPDRALPLLEKVLQGDNTLKVKEQALFVLTQCESPEAHKVLARYARGESDPDLQMRAVEYLGLFGGEENRQLLEDVYQSAASTDVKEKILDSYMLAGDAERLYSIAKREQDSDLRGNAINQLGLMGRTEMLWQLYRQEIDSDLRQKIIESFMLAGDTERLDSIAMYEKDPELRQAAIQQLGLIGDVEPLHQLYRQETSPDIKAAIIDALFLHGDVEGLLAIAKAEDDPDLKGEAITKLGLQGGREHLRELYQEESSPEIKMDILDALFLQGDADGLLAIARTEKDRELRKHAIEKLSLLDSDAATDFFMELLEK